MKLPRGKPLNAQIAFQLRMILFARAALMIHRLDFEFLGIQTRPVRLDTYLGFEKHLPVLIVPTLMTNHNHTNIDVSVLGLQRSYKTCVIDFRRLSQGVKRDHTANTIAITRDASPWSDFRNTINRRTKTRRPEKLANLEQSRMIGQFGLGCGDDYFHTKWVSHCEGGNCERTTEFTVIYALHESFN